MTKGNPRSDSDFSSELGRFLHTFDDEDEALERGLKAISDEQHRAAMQRIVRKVQSQEEHSATASEIDQVWTSVEDVLAADPQALKEIDALTSEDQRASFLQVEVYNLSQAVIGLREELQVLTWKKQKIEHELEQAGKVAIDIQDGALAKALSRTAQASVEAEEILTAARKNAADILARAEANADRIKARASAQETRARRLDALAHERVVSADRKARRTGAETSPNRKSGIRISRETCPHCLDRPNSIAKDATTTFGQALSRLERLTRTRNRRATADYLDSLLRDDPYGHADWLLRHVIAAGLRLVDKVEAPGEIADQVHTAAQRDESRLARSTGYPSGAVGLSRMQAQVIHGTPDRGLVGRREELELSNHYRQIISPFEVPQEACEMIRPLIASCAKRNLQVQMIGVSTAGDSRNAMVLVAIHEAAVTVDGGEPNARREIGACDRIVDAQPARSSVETFERNRARVLEHSVSRLDVKALAPGNSLEFREMLGWKRNRMFLWSVLVVLGYWFNWASRQIRVGLVGATTSLAWVPCMPICSRIPVGPPGEATVPIGGRHLELPG